MIIDIDIIIENKKHTHFHNIQRNNTKTKTKAKTKTKTDKKKIYFNENVDHAEKYHSAGLQKQQSLPSLIDASFPL